MALSAKPNGPVAAALNHNEHSTLAGGPVMETLTGLANAPVLSTGCFVAWTTLGGVGFGLRP